jgi:hypothetical protein
MTPAFDPDLNAAIVLIATHAIALVVGLALGYVARAALARGGD